MAASLFRRLGAVIEEATLIGLEVGPGSRRVILRLGVPADGEPESPRRERTVVLHGVSRVAVWLRRVQYGPGPDRVPRDVYPAERVPDVRELSNWLRRWSGYRLSGQPGEIFDAPDVPAWLGSASLDLAWPEDSRGAHS